MKYLLDTQALLYLGCDELDRIGKKALKTYLNPDSIIMISQVSFWEIAIKTNIGKLSVPIGLKNIIHLSTLAGIETIPIKNDHILSYQTLALHSGHKDPFDRLIISTAKIENCKVISSDKQFDLYPDINRVWE